MKHINKKAIHSIAVKLSSSDQKNSKGMVFIQSWNEKERVMRALQVLGILWALGLLSVLIPLAHFILVPGFILAGPIVAFKAYQINEAITHGQGICPHCGRELIIEKALVKWPLSDICTNCQTAISIMPI